MLAVALCSITGQSQRLLKHVHDPNRLDKSELGAGTLERKASARGPQPPPGSSMLCADCMEKTHCIPAVYQTAQCHHHYPGWLHTAALPHIACVTYCLSIDAQ